MLRNKITIECCNILKYEIESIVEQFVPLKKNNETGLEGNTCQNKLLTNSVGKKTMRRVYMRTRKNEDYTNCKEALMQLRLTFYNLNEAVSKS